MTQNTRSHRTLKIAGIIALVVVVALLGFAGNFLFDFALNPRAIHHEDDAGWQGRQRR